MYVENRSSDSHERASEAMRQAENPQRANLCGQTIDGQVVGRPELSAGGERSRTIANESKRRLSERSVTKHNPLSLQGLAAVRMCYPLFERVSRFCNSPNDGKAIFEEVSSLTAEKPHLWTSEEVIDGLGKALSEKLFPKWAIVQDEAGSFNVLRGLVRLARMDSGIKSTNDLLRDVTKGAVKHCTQKVNSFLTLGFYVEGLFSGGELSEFEAGLERVFQERVLEIKLKWYQQLAAERREESSNRFEFAQNLLSLGRLRREAGEVHQASELIEQSGQVLEELIEKDRWYTFFNADAYRRLRSELNEQIDELRGPMSTGADETAPKSGRL
jgi:hypothetical protein